MNVHRGLYDNLIGRSINVLCDMVETSKVLKMFTAEDILSFSKTWIIDILESAEVLKIRFEVRV